MLEHSDAAFPKTRWSLIDAIVAGNDLEREQASLILATTYWPAIYAFLRRGGKPREQALELTQAFFADVIVERELFTRARSDRGSLRALLQTALKHYLVDEHRRRMSRPHTFAISLSDASAEDAVLDQNAGLGPEAFFDRRWALAILEEALRRCEAHFSSTGKKLHWDAFELRIVKPALAMTDAPSHDDIAKRLRLAHADDSIAAVRVVRKRLIAILQQIIAELCEDVEEQEAEYREVMDLLR